MLHIFAGRPLYKRSSSVNSLSLSLKNRKQTGGPSLRTVTPYLQTSTNASPFNKEMEIALLIQPSSFHQTTGTQVNFRVGFVENKKCSR